MLVAVAVLVALVVLLAGLWAVESRRGRERLAAATARAEEAEAAGADLRNQLDEATAAAEAERFEAAAALARAESAHRDTSRRLDEVEARRTDTARKLDDAAAEVAAQRSRAEAAEADCERLRHELGEAESRNARLQLRLEAGVDGSVELAALWDLEIARSERTWRYSVAPLPLGPSPFTDAPDPLRLAVEVEAAALREEVGAPLEVRWEAGPVEHPGHALLVLRLAQELLAGAAREGQTAILHANGDQDVVLHLVGEDEDPPIEPDIPAVAGPLVTVESDHGIRLVVHQDRAIQPR